MGRNDSGEKDFFKKILQKQCVFASIPPKAQRHRHGVMLLEVRKGAREWQAPLHPGHFEGQTPPLPPLSHPSSQQLFAWPPLLPSALPIHVLVTKGPRRVRPRPRSTGWTRGVQGARGTGLRQVHTRVRDPEADASRALREHARLRPRGRGVSGSACLRHRVGWRGRGVEE